MVGHISRKYVELKIIPRIPVIELKIRLAFDRDKPMNLVNGLWTSSMDHEVLETPQVLGLLLDSSLSINDLIDYE